MSSIPLEIPKEYHRIFQEIPENEITSFSHSFSTTDQSEHKYLRLIEAIEKTLLVYTSPSPYWLFLYGRISFVATMYNELIEYWNKPENNGKPELGAFVARILTFQNKYDEAIEIAKSTLEQVDRDQNMTLLDILILFESYFTLGLAYSYTRQFDQAEEVIASLEKYSSMYIIKKTVSDSHFLDLVYIEHIIKGYLNFFRGQPKEMQEALGAINSWVDGLNDPWLKGFYYNVYGISKMMFQEITEGEAAMRKAFDAFDEVHDLRGYTTVGANLALSLINKGLRQEAREYYENLIPVQVKMKNYWLAVGNMLEVAKTYLDEKKIDDALGMLNWAEEISQEGNIQEPQIMSMFSYFYSRVGNMEKSADYLQQIKGVIDAGDVENYSKLFYHNAAAVNAMAINDLNKATEEIEKGIEIADNSGYFNYAVELAFIHLEIIFKSYLVDQKQNILLKGLEILKDIAPLIEKAQHAYYETLFHVSVSYVLLAMDDQSEALDYIEKAKEITKDYPESAQYKEILLFEERLSFLKRASPTVDTQNPLFSEFLDNWLSDEYLSIFYVLEALRLFTKLQFEKTNIGQQKADEDIMPQMLFIVGSGGITIFTHKFKDDAELDEVLVGGFLSALTTFSQELFGGGMLTRIDQENHVLLMERISEHNILVLIVDEETYLIRKKFKKFSSELSRMDLVNYLGYDQVLSKFDPQYTILKGLIDIIFLGSEEDLDKIGKPQ